MEKRNILLVDDEKAIVKMIETVLRKEGFEHIYTAHTAKEAFAIVEQKQIDLIVLDVMLPDHSGFELAPKIREISEAYILFVTAKVSDLDVLTGFATGGDDYVTKPFNPLEIAARIKAHFRRFATAGTLPVENRPKQYHFGHFLLDEDKGELIVEGRTVSCPTQVYLLLLYLCKHPNKVFSKSELLEAVWGFNHYVDDNTVPVHIRRIRERIEVSPSQPQYLLTVRGLGYKLVQGKIT
ncbi:response regulator transcription factor [Bacillus sp. Hm123]|uniref:response regulator transcription factor n=1 Tax=Bacillus sp. Hm123 TaxID=3450745 RepID=UPI003F439FA5